IMRVHLVNPSDTSFGTAVITPRWLYVLAAATPEAFGDPVICDETLEHLDPLSIAPGDVVGIGIHTGNALRGYRLGLQARERGATVIFGGIHSTLYPEEAFARGGAHAVVKGDGDRVWGEALSDCRDGALRRIYEGGRVSAERFELMSRLAALPKDMIFFTQITMEAAEDPQFLDAMRAARIKGALVGVEAVTPEGLKSVYKDFNCSGEDLVRRLQEFRSHGIHILGSFIFGLPSDRQGTFYATP